MQSIVELALVYVRETLESARGNTSTGIVGGCEGTGGDCDDFGKMPPPPHPHPAPGKFNVKPRATRIEDGTEVPTFSIEKDLRGKGSNGIG
ncbi:unnamed protein product, partial [Choristocarpus tenellus]